MKRATRDFSGSSKQSPFKSYLLLILIPITIFYLLTLRPGHDWGGDFAQYIGHAKNIASGKPYAEIGYIYCPYYPTKGPREYPPGFPMLLAPIYRIFGLSFLAFKLEILAFLLGSTIVLVLFSREYLSDVSKGVFILLFAMNPYVVSLKDHVISDIPFLFFVFVFLVWTNKVYESKGFTLKAAAICGVLIFVSYLIRGPGLLLIPTLLVYDVYSHRKISGFALIAVSVSVVLTLLSKVFFHSETSYVEQFLRWRPGVVPYNIRYYLSAFSELWPQIAGIQASKYVLFVSASLLAAVGLGVRRRISIGEIFLAGYVALILLFPFRQGLRYFLPVIPFYFLYLLVGVEFATKMVKQVAIRRIIVGLLASLACASYLSGLTVIVRDSSSLPDGPFVPEATEMFGYLREKTSPDATVVFTKPRVLALFSGRSATAYPLSQDDEFVLKYFKDVGVDYVIADLNSEDDTQYLIPIIRKRPSDFQEVFRNERFAVYMFEDNVSQTVNG